MDFDSLNKYQVPMNKHSVLGLGKVDVQDQLPLIYGI